MTWCLAITAGACGQRQSGTTAAPGVRGAAERDAEPGSDGPPGVGQRVEPRPAANLFLHQDLFSIFLKHASKHFPDSSGIMML